MVCCSRDLWRVGGDSVEGGLRFKRALRARPWQRLSPQQVHVSDWSVRRFSRFEARKLGCWCDRETRCC
jgi:hypothetical protein